MPPWYDVIIQRDRDSGRWNKLGEKHVVAEQSAGTLHK